ncbi:regulatory helix-turn-helix LysR family protein [Paraburkholderia sp. BL23I1N1]|nr:regulatory helix-turn-helix LysR family protein [Paraburkholderia sp. BL27I4N3]RKE35476.1 regulatory helix-turn-helix LysR family protein [Paraburkholderia sp. BL23I1N1]
MRFKGLDLNLLVALDALMTERNLTAAARSINLSQPAMSAAVARLRAYFCDELFTMRGRELVPTPRAEGLAAPIQSARLWCTSSSPLFPGTSSTRPNRIAASGSSFPISWQSYFFERSWSVLHGKLPPSASNCYHLPMTPMRFSGAAKPTQAIFFNDDRG